MGDLRLTARGHRFVENAVALGLLLVLALLLLAGYLIGEHRRCDWLTNHHNPNAATYCPTKETR